MTIANSASTLLHFGFFSMLLVFRADLWPLLALVPNLGVEGGSKMKDERTKNPLLQNSSSTDVPLFSCEWIKLDGAIGDIMRF